MPSICTLTGGAWQDTHGNVVANGTLILTLCQDAVVASSNQVAPTLVTFPLDSSGNLQSGATVYANTALSPSGTFYTAEVLNSGGSRVWGPEKWSLSVGTTNASTIVPALANAQIVSPLTIETNGINNASQVLLNFQDTASVTWSNPSGGNVQATATGGLPGSAFRGDTVRYNEYGTAAWVNTIGVPRFVVVTCDGPTGSATPVSIGQNNQPGTLGTRSTNAWSATEQAGFTYTSGAGASTNVGAYIIQGFGVTDGFYTFGLFERFAIRLRMNNTTTVRYWIGLGAKTPSGANYAVDIPNFAIVGYRFSAGTDTTIKAVSQTDNTHQTVADTGVSVDTTNSQLFEIVKATSGYTFLINGNTVANITTNNPTTATTYGTVWVADNQNNAVAVSAMMSFSTMTFKSI